ncbi:hypothetical protein ABT010_13125 [Streptomyces sp. NPDC002668]|uniref:hypothetical protein n=1 Tax=Streptomyces sp. NPDC002668 TaxID=3154422 RepID=UPI0033190DA5
MSSSSQNPAPISSSTARDEFVAGLRAFADFLEQNPGVKAPGDQRLLLALTTNDAVESFAVEHGLPLEFDKDGNAFCDLAFGPVVYHAYGYVDFNKHCEQANEKRARRWAEAKGLALVPAEGGAL